MSKYSPQLWALFGGCSLDDLPFRIGNTLFGWLTLAVLASKGYNLSVDSTGKHSRCLGKGSNGALL